MRRLEYSRAAGEYSQPDLLCPWRNSRVRANRLLAGTELPSQVCLRERV
jgi:hypothetical protein